MNRMAMNWIVDGTAARPSMRRHLSPRAKAMQLEINRPNVIAN